MPAANVSSDSSLDAARPSRGKSKKPNWKYKGPLSVITLDLDLSGDPATRKRVEQQFSAGFQLDRALKRQAGSALRAYWAAHGEREREGPGAVRERLRLSRSGFEKNAYAHLDDSVWMRDHLTKAIACHEASRVWKIAERNLFKDATGKRFGILRPGKWFDFTTLAGRARSHTKPNTWETWRLVGTLEGHREAFPAAGDGSVFSQPGSLPTPTVRDRKGHPGWWTYRGAFAVLFTGLAGGDIVMPVRLPQGQGSFAHLQHFLGNPDLWHKINLVRIQDRRAPGGWRYQAHLTILSAGYQSPATLERREGTPTDRLVGMDANVSNLAVVSMPASTLTKFDQFDDVLLVDQVKLTPAEELRAADAALLQRRRNRALDRSRRSSNPEQYQLSAKQERRAKRRADKGLPERTTELRKGPRVANAAGKPTQAYRKDDLTPAYRKLRADLAQTAAATAMRRNSVARRIAQELVSVHGNRWVTEDVKISSWTALWGKRIQVTTPGRMRSAMKAEVLACEGTWRLASTRTTVMSQHCLCGFRQKKTLAERWHYCPNCGLSADRDVLSAGLAACVTFTDPEDSSTASVNPTLTAVLARRVCAQKEERVQSTITYRELACDNPDGSTPGASAGRNDSVDLPRNRNSLPQGKGRRRRNSQAVSSERDRSQDL